MRTRRSELVASGFLVTCTAVVLCLAAIVTAVVLGESLAVVFDSERDVSFHIWDFLLGTAWFSAVAVSISVPLGFAVAVSLRELAPPMLKVAARPAITLFATMPPIVFAYVALALEHATKTRFAAVLALGVLLAPFVTSLFDGALRATAPERLRDAALALGATRLEAWIRVVMPTAARGLGSAVLLVFVRAIGESVIVGLAAPLTTTTLAAEPLRAAAHIIAGVDRHEVFIIGAVLVAVTLVLHRIAMAMHPQERT